MERSEPLQLLQFLFNALMRRFLNVQVFLHCACADGTHEGPLWVTHVDSCVDKWSRKKPQKTSNTCSCQSCWTVFSPAFQFTWSIMIGKTWELQIKFVEISSRSRNILYIFCATKKKSNVKTSERWNNFRKKKKKHTSALSVTKPWPALLGWTHSGLTVDWGLHYRGLLRGSNVRSGR